MFSRNVITRRGRGFRGNFPSRKLGRMVAGESLVELLAILLWEFSPGVLTYRVAADCNSVRGWRDHAGLLPRLRDRFDDR